MVVGRVVLAATCAVGGSFALVGLVSGAWRVAGAVGSVEVDGAVGMHRAVPALLVQDQVVMCPAVGFDVLGVGAAAVGVVLDVVRLGFDRGPVAAGPGAFAVPDRDGDAELAGNVPLPADIEDQRSAAEHG